MNESYLAIIDQEDGSQKQGNVCSNILFNDALYRPNSMGNIDLGTLEPGLSVVTILLNSSSYETDEEGYVRLPTLAHAVQMNDKSFTAGASGVVDLGKVCTGIKFNGLPYIVGNDGVINLGTIEIPEMPDISGIGGKIHTGEGGPPASLGSDGDFYYDMSS